MKKSVEGYVCHESGLNCVHVVWRLFGVAVWWKDFGLADREAVKTAETFAGYNASDVTR